DSLPKTKLANVTLKDASTEIDIVLYSEKVDALAVRSRSPRWQVNLHNADGIFAGNSEGVPSALDNHDAGDQPRTQVVFYGTGHDGFGQTAAFACTDFILLQEVIHRTNRRTGRHNNRLKACFLYRLFQLITRKYRPAGLWKKDKQSGR